MGLDSTFYLSILCVGVHIVKDLQVSMKLWVLSRRNCCQIMIPNVPKPMLLAHFRLDSVGVLIVYFSKNTNHIFIYIFQAHPGSRWSAHGGPIQGPDGAPLQRALPGPRWSALAGPIQGPGETPPDPDPDPEELSDPNQGPFHRAQGENTSLRGPSL